MNTDLAVFSRCKALQSPVTDAPANQAQGRAADGGGHAAHLPVAPLGNGQLQPAVRHTLALAHRRMAGPEPFRRVAALNLRRAG